MQVSILAGARGQKSKSTSTATSESGITESTSATTRARSVDMSPTVEHCWGLIIWLKNSLIIAIGWIQIDGKLTFIPFQLLFFFRMPDSVKRHDVLQFDVLLGDGPGRDVDHWKVLRQHVAPESASPDWLKDLLGNGHACILSMAVKLFLCAGEVDDVGYTLQYRKIPWRVWLR